MKRNTLVKIHVALSIFFLPLILIFTLSGVLSYFDYEGDYIVNELMIIDKSQLPLEDDKFKKAITKIFKENNISYSFTSYKVEGAELILQPSYKKHIRLVKSDYNIRVIEVTPDFFRKILDIHKGRSGYIFRIYSIIWGLCFAISALTGVILGMKNSKLRKEIIIYSTSGTLITFLILILS